MFTPLIEQLIKSFTCLPGVGTKSAQRMALHILERNREGGERLAKNLLQAIDNVRHCQRCRTLSENDLCKLCQNPRRTQDIVCVVETPADIIAIEQSAGFTGQYFVLMGRLSPIDGIGPEQLGIAQLVERVKADKIKELILAVSPTMEGEATVHFIAECLSNEPVKVTRIAHGVPIGGELEFVDSHTLSHAISGRKVIQ